MVIAPLLPNESQRLLALQGYQLLDTLPEEEFDEITRLAAAVCQAPIALISLVDDKRQWFKSKVGLDICETNRDLAFCTHTMASGYAPLIVPDTREDERFHDNPLVTGEPNIAFYAGIPLVDEAGYALGSLCVIDQQPRELSIQQIDALKLLAKLVLEKMETRRARLSSPQQEDFNAQELKVLVDNAPLLIVKTNDELQIAYANSAKANAVGESVLNLFPASFREVAKSRLQQALELGQLTTFEYEQENSGKISWHLVQVKRISYQEGRASLLVLIEDITEGKELEIEKDDLLRELKAKVNALQQYNYIVSHNLRGPIVNVLGLSNLLLNMPEHLSEEEKKHYLSKMHDATVNIDEIIQDLTSILALQNPLGSKRDVIDFQEMIDGTISSLQTFIDEARADVQVWVDPAIGSFTSFRSYVQSILYNLINNAIKHRAKNRQLQIAVKVNRQPGKLVLKVSDNGQGINLHKHGEQLFGLYKRFNPYVEGRGLGLHMTKMQVNALGGTIEVESKEGRGTTFTVSFATETAEAADRNLGNQMWIEEAS